jgi:hypothetical protein
MGESLATGTRHLSPKADVTHAAGVDVTHSADTAKAATSAIYRRPSARR